MTLFMKLKVFVRSANGRNDVLAFDRQTESIN